MPGGHHLTTARRALHTLGLVNGGVERRLRRLGRRGRRAVVAAVVHGEEQVCGCWFPRAEQVDRTSLFEIGSITKAFTGVLLADMVLSGDIALEDPLSRHLSTRRPAWRHREPTLLELATHRSGLPNTPGPMNRRELLYAMGFGAADPWARLTPKDYERLVAKESPRRAPGERVRYSSLAVGLLGDALAARAGTTYGELLAERVLQPLGMRATSVQPPPALARQVVSGHSRRGRPRPPIKDLMPAAGSLRSNAEDMLRFLWACLHPPAEGSRPCSGPRPTAACAHRPPRRSRPLLDDRRPPRSPTRHLAQRRHLGLPQLRRLRAPDRNSGRRSVEQHSQRRPTWSPAGRDNAITSTAPSAQRTGPARSCA